MTEDSKDKLLLAAIDVFSEKGYGAASMSMVATRAGLSKASVFHHFNSKERLYSEVFSAVFSSINSLLSNIEDQLTDNFEDSIRLITEAVLSFEENNANSIKLVVWELMNPSTQEHQNQAKSLLHNSFHNVVAVTNKAHQASKSKKKINADEIALKITSQATYYFIFGGAMRDSQTSPITNNVESFLGWLTSDIVK